ncbi:unnamed protein product [Cylindrotheca closterium]|uniref:CSC1/OSCA1-like 7TM region domain-containing protein n=1 Tax=Cylindrotheca closterium TaxID=2856 RepID=A0AAD2G8E2_9STRA|nr:unnamed protein product [Cylindrotheca closterium]
MMRRIALAIALVIGGGSATTAAFQISLPVSSHTSRWELSALAPGSTITTVTMMANDLTTSPLVETSSSLSLLASDAPSWLQPLLANPAFWTTSVLLIIVGMLVTWDTMVERAREAMPPAIATVIDNILMEMGSLGFIGLILSAALNNPVSPLQTGVAHLSEVYLGDGELLLESFHFLHELFFQVAIVYFFGSAFMTQRVINSIEFASDLAEKHAVAHKQCLTGDDTLDEECLAMEDYQDMLRQYQETRSHESDNVFLRELTISTTERGTEALVIRERIQQEVLHLPEWYRLDKDLEEAFATEELNLIKIAPSTWLPLIPILALAASVDLGNDVANPGSIEAIASSGYFVATPGVFYPLMALQLLKLGWGLLNFWKMATIKDMLIPRLTTNKMVDPATELVTKPAGESATARRFFASTPWFAEPVETVFAKPSTNRVQELFGTVGGNGVNFYFESIKLHTWLCVATLVAFAFQIIPRDLFAFFSNVEGVGIPSQVVPELMVQGTYAVMNIVFLLYVSPIAFMNFAIISCAERAVAQHEEISVEPKVLTSLVTSIESEMTPSLATVGSNSTYALAYEEATDSTLFTNQRDEN